MPESNTSTTRRLRLRYRDECSVCGIELSRGTEAIWDSGEKTVTCLACAPAEGAPEPGTAGSSAASEGARRRAKKIEDVRRKHGDHAAAVAEQMAERDNAASWGKGSHGESRLAAFVAREAGDSVIPLHDRLIPGTRGNIDHIFVASTGVWVVDAKSYKGKVEKRERGPIWRRESEVYVGRRNRTALTKSVETQVTAVKAALEPDPELRGTPVYGSLCFLDSDWGGLFDSPFSVGAVWIAYPRALKKSLKKQGPLAREKMERIARRLDLSLPRAAS